MPTYNTAKMKFTCPENVMFFEHPGYKFRESADPTKVSEMEIVKSFAPEGTRFLDIAVNYGARHHAPREMSYNEKAELGRIECAPYRALLFTTESADQSEIAELLTNDSLVVVKMSAPEGCKFIKTGERNGKPIGYTVPSYRRGGYQVFTPQEYLWFIWNRLADDLQPIIHDEDFLYRLKCDLARFDFCDDPNLADKLGTPLDNISASEYALDSIYRTHNFNINVDHFNPDMVEEEITMKGLSVGQRAKGNRSAYSAEYIKSILQARKAFFSWTNQLSPELREEMYRLKEVPECKTCEFCNNRYSNLKTKCPICHVENPTCLYTDENPNWFGDCDDED